MTDWRTQPIAPPTTNLHTEYHAVRLQRTCKSPHVIFDIGPPVLKKTLVVSNHIRIPRQNMLQLTFLVRGTNRGSPNVCWHINCQCWHKSLSPVVTGNFFSFLDWERSALRLQDCHAWGQRWRAIVYLQSSCRLWFTFLDWERSTLWFYRLHS